MAGSRLERFGTVFSRVRDLMCSGVIKPSDKPIWFDVYKAFPPKKEPLYVKTKTRASVNKQSNVPAIFYTEDKVRAWFYEHYGTGSRLFDLSNSNYVSVCQRFVLKYTELKSNSELEDSALYEMTAKALLSEGITLKRRARHPVESSTEPIFELKLTEMMAEQH
uniref:Small ribosomal subunit protein mS23 n=1 Tax=Iconisemion striatum TaxID=60296 RepID=A0A1A7YKW6_9TELE